VRALASAAAAALVLGVGSTASAGPRAHLRLVDLTPLTVQGTTFRAGERVTLLVSAGTSVTRHVRAGPRGGFRVRFWFSVPKCTSVDVQAIGARGSRATTGIGVAGCDEDD
jgi:hypothetical protein